MGRSPASASRRREAGTGGASEGRAEAGAASDGDEAGGGGPLDAGAAPPDVQPATAMTVNATRSGRFIVEVLRRRQASRARRRDLGL